MTPTSRAELERLAEACERAAETVDEHWTPSHVSRQREALASASALLRTLATSDVEGVAERLDQIAGPESSIARTGALLLRASAAREAEAVRAEREACADLACNATDLCQRWCRDQIASRIRARGETGGEEG